MKVLTELYRYNILSSEQKVNLESFDSIILIAPKQAMTKTGFKPFFNNLPENLTTAIDQYTKKIQFKFDAEQTCSFDFSFKLRVCLGVLPEDRTMFALLSFAKELCKPLLDTHHRQVILDLRSDLEMRSSLADAFVSTLIALKFDHPKYTEKEQDKKYLTELTIVTPNSSIKELNERVKAADHVTQGTNLVRYLALTPGNELTCEKYHDKAEELAQQEGLKTEWLSYDKLKTLKAGAFVAVSQGSAQKTAGILKIKYQPPAATKHIILVGKGITFDTGGVNLKPAQYMFGMHQDMSGSAVVLATIISAKKQKWPGKVTAYLAIAENAISETAYRPNDVITACNGTTIEVVHTDAEGRMVLADTLALASKEKPDLILDFATLTGSCVAAIGEVYSGAFTNREELHPKIIEAGKVSGERVWPFPLDKDYGKPLKSDVADIKQCLLSKSPDHIEAAHFLSQFVDKVIPWVHVDLSAIEHEGGLAHIDTKHTGFGVRFANEFCMNFINSKKVRKR